MVSPLILIIEDEPHQAEMLRYNLEREGFRTKVLATGEEALAAVEERLPDLIVVDWMLPECSGIDICRRLRKNPETRKLPIIMLTARGEESDRVLGLDVGADDYIVKPYSPRELIARMRALLRRAGPDESDETLECSGVVMDTGAHKVTRDGHAIHLGPTDFRLLHTLMKRPGRVHSRDTLLDKVWGRDVYVEDRTVDVHIRRLRRALNQNGGADLIRTVRGAGYAFDGEGG